MSAAKWTAILLAGQRPGIDPLAAHFGEQWKALVKVEGESMLSRVARTLLASPAIGGIVVVAQRPDALFVGDAAWLGAEPRVSTAVSTSGIAVSVAALAGTTQAPWPVLVTTADHPLLTPAMIEALTTGAASADVGVGVVSSRVLLGRYPGNRRTWLKFAGGHWTGANLFTLGSAQAQAALRAWSEVERDRKKALKLIWHFGPVLALRAMTRTITLAGALGRAGRKLGATVVPVELPFADAGIDVDKPSDHSLAEQILRDRAAAAPG